MIDSLRTGKESPKNSKKNMRERKPVVMDRFVYEIRPVMIDRRKYYNVDITQNDVSINTPRICGLATQTPQERYYQARFFCAGDILKRLGMVAA